MKKLIPFGSEIEEEMILSGLVKGIQPYGAFIEIQGGIVGLLPIQDISVARMKSPEERLQIGQTINVKIKSIDSNKNQIYFTHKELLGSWEENVQSFQEGTKVTGIVRDIEKAKNGIFIELTPNLVGMAEYAEDMEYGQEVEVYIKKIIPEKKKIKLIIC